MLVGGYFLLAALAALNINTQNTLIDMHPPTTRTGAIQPRTSSVYIGAFMFILRIYQTELVYENFALLIFMSEC